MEDDDCDDGCGRSIAEGMTEEEAMEIWMRRDREFARERQLRLQKEQQLALLKELQQDKGIQPIQQTSRRSPSPMSDRENYLDDEDGEEVPASQYQHNSAAWNAAISQNALGEYDPKYHNAYVAYQRFMDVNRPGLAEAYVPSTPGLARLIEQQRQEETLASVRRREREDLEVRQMEAMEGLCSLRMGVGGGGAQASSQVAAAGPLSNPQARVDPLTAQAIEYERFSQAHRQQASAESSSSNTSNTAGTTTTDKEKKKDDADSDVSKFYLATPFPTEYNTKPVRCFNCNICLHTHPLAANYFCQTCCQISTVAITGRKGDADAAEEKMADKEDYGGEEDIEMAYWY